MVTTLFCDLVSSVALGELLDPEPLREVMHRYYEAVRIPIERHGGRVENLIGDAVLACFGIPKSHEDDALRAIRAASEMQDAVRGLNKELDRDYGVTLEIRIGVNTGEVMTEGTGEVLGDSVNVAARLQQSAAPGEIIIGAASRRLVRHAIVAQELEPISLKGKSKPVQAWRLQELIPGIEGIARRFDSPMIGRDRELSLLRDAFQRAVRERSCQLFTVLGAAGVGKSRLVRELSRVAEGGARIVGGRCLPYGRGITYFPVREIVEDAAGLSDALSIAESLERIHQVVQDDHDAEIVERHVAALCGISNESLPGEEIFWAIRRFLEAMARHSPLIVVFEDIHWAEPTLLDLIDHVTRLSRDAPMLVVCPARPELLDARPSWGGGKINASSISLEPLSKSDSAKLMQNLLGETSMPAELRSRVAEAAGGNPLFVEQVLSMLIDDGLLIHEHGRWTPEGDLSRIAIPPTIQALLSARLDRLTAKERDLIERAAIVGREFSRASVAELLGNEASKGMDEALSSLVQRDLVLPVKSSVRDTFRFRHVLIVDATYQATLKRTRADLHERFATWLETQSPEEDEILGFHLERAFRCREELGVLEQHARAIGDRAAEHLASAGHRALTRGDSGALGILERAIALMNPQASGRARLLLDVASAAKEMGDYARAGNALKEALTLSKSQNEVVLRLQATLWAAVLETDLSPRPDASERVRQYAERAIAQLPPSEHEALGSAFLALCESRVLIGRWVEYEQAAQRAAGHFRKAGNLAREAAALGYAQWALCVGPIPIGEVLRRFEEIERGISGSFIAEADHSIYRGVLAALGGDFQKARELFARGTAALESVGMSVRATNANAVVGSWIEFLAGDLFAAERAIRKGFSMYERTGAKLYNSTLAGLRADYLVMQGRLDEGFALTQEAQDTGLPKDSATQILYRVARSKILAARGLFDDAEVLAREAVSISGETDTWEFKHRAFMALAEVLRAAQRPDEAIKAGQQALAVCEAKGAVPLIERVRRFISARDASTPA